MTLDAAAEALTEAAFRTGDFSVAERLLGDALSAAPDAASEAAALHHLGWLMHWRAIDSIVDGQVRESDPDAEEALFQRALDIRRTLRDQAGIAASLFGVGLVRQVLRHDWHSAIDLFRSALPLAEDLVNVIREVHTGNRPIPPGVAAALAVRKVQPSLTPREIEVVHLIAEGLRNKEIAVALGISEETAKVHVKNILAKLNVSDRSAVVAVAVRRGIIHIR